MNINSIKLKSNNDRLKFGYSNMITKIRNLYKINGIYF